MRNRNNIASYGNKGTKGIRCRDCSTGDRGCKNNALRNSLNNAEFFVGKAEEVVPRIYDEDMKKRKMSLLIQKKVLDCPIQPPLSL